MDTTESKSLQLDAVKLISTKEIDIKNQTWYNKIISMYVNLIQWNLRDFDWDRTWRTSTTWECSFIWELFVFEQDFPIKNNHLSVRIL